jgi:branched-subunit amino acid aminotransferase/4-amino-4-deoxychorismate lyase
VNGPVKLALADAPVPDEDLRFRHKTTARSGYVQLRGARSDIDDVILWDQRELVIESSIYNIWIGQGSVLKTPRLERSGLPGVYRDYLLHSGKGEIADITVSDLKAADQIFVSNAVRGLLPATLISAEPRSDRL